MIKQVRQSYQGMIKDIARYKPTESTYFDASGIRIFATDSESTYSLTNEKGTKVELSFPSVTISGTKITYTTSGLNTITLNTKDPIPVGIFHKQTLNGYSTIVDGVIFFTTSKTSISRKCDFIWSYKKNVLKLLYARDLGFTTDNPITAISNYENNTLEKVYWIDGKHQLRSLNIRKSIQNEDSEEIWDTPLETLNMVSTFNMSQPIIDSLSTGGKHTAGTIQYAYNLYKVNSSQSQISPLSSMVALGNGNLGGGGLNEFVNTTPVIHIDNIDAMFSNIKVYSIKYNTYLGEPVISVIRDMVIPESRELMIYDDNTVISNITAEELLFLGADIIIPNTIGVKDNRMFFANHKEVNFNVDLDMKAYSFSEFGISKTYHNVKSFTAYDKERVINFRAGDPYPEIKNDKFDNVNLNFDLYNLKAGSSGQSQVRGGSGLYCEYELAQTKEFNPTSKYLKDQEIYRLGIIFYNIYGKASNPLWISDFKAPEGNLLGNYNILKFKLTTKFYQWVAQQTDNYLKPTGYRVLIAERRAEDKTILASGAMSNMFVNLKDSEGTITALEAIRAIKSETAPKLPSFLMRNVTNNPASPEKLFTRPLANASHLYTMDRVVGPDTEFIHKPSGFGGLNLGGRSWQYDEMFQMYCPEAIFNDSIYLPKTARFKLKGMMRNTFNSVWTKEMNPNGDILGDGKGIQGISPRYAISQTVTEGNAGALMDYGLISHPGGTNEDNYMRSLWYRQYGMHAILDPDPLQTVAGYTAMEVPNEKVKQQTQINDTAADVWKTVSTSGGKDSMYLSITTTAFADKINMSGMTFNIRAVVPSQKYSCILRSVLDGDPQPDVVFSNLTGNQIVKTPPKVLASSSVTDRKVTLQYSIYIKPESGIFEGWATGSGTFEVFRGNIKGMTCTYILDDTYINADANSTQPPVDDKPYYFPAITKNILPIVGSPEFTRRGQSYKNYNQDSKLRYSNTLQSVKTDGMSGWKEAGRYGRRIVSIDSDGQSCITFQVYKNDIKKPLRSTNIMLDAGLNVENSILYGEIVKSDNDIYLGGIYGGNRYEDKIRTKYLEIGAYMPIDATNSGAITILSPGDTFVQNFRFLRVVQRDQSVLDQGTYHMEEMVEYPTETTVDLKNRNDESFGDWDSKLTYGYENFHRYNRAYSQPNNLIIHQDVAYTERRNDIYGTTVTASKLKTSGELIDNWLDPLVNETIDVDGRYGVINKLVSFNDNIYAFQDKAISMLSINPRIQMPTEDGVGIELGVGGVLADYNYLTTDSGSKNVFSICPTPYGIYYYDDHNKKIGLFNGKINSLSETAGMHSFMQQENFKRLDKDRPQTSTGVLTGYDYLNNEVLFTFKDVNNIFTLVFNEKNNMFVTNVRNRNASWYISSGDTLYSYQDENIIHRHNVGKYNEYHGKPFESQVTFLVNPETDIDTILNSAMFKSECYDENGNDLFDRTITHVRVYNEYQDSGRIPLVNNRRGNLRRLFRDWNIALPRHANSRQRVRNPWNYLELTFVNPDNSKLILHDVVVNYTI